MARLYMCICVLFSLQLAFAQTQKEEEFGINTKNCKQCNHYFKDDDRQLCVDMFCESKTKNRKNFQNKKRCDACVNRYTSTDEKRKTCQKGFCETTAPVDPPMVFEAALAITTDILCSYCNTIKNTTTRANCRKQYKCL